MSDQLPFEFDEISFDDVEPIQDYALLPEGSYDAEIVKAEFGNSPRKGSPQIELEFDITQEGFEGRKFFENMSLVDSARPFLMRDLIALGVRTREQLKAEGLKLDARVLSALTGTRCTIMVRHSKSDDGQRTFANVRRYLEYGQGRGSSGGTTTATASTASAGEQVEVDEDLSELFS